MRIYLHQNETTWGPYELEQVQELLQQGSITAGVLAAVEGSDQWTPLGDLVRIEGVVPVLPPRLFTPPTWQVARQNTGQIDSLSTKNTKIIKNARNQHRLCYLVILIIAGYKLTMGFLVSVANGNPAWATSNPAPLIAIGAAYLILGILVVHESFGALTIVVAFYICTALFTSYELLVLGGTDKAYFVVFYVIFRLIFLIPIVQGFGAISKLQGFGFR